MTADPKCTCGATQAQWHSDDCPRAPLQLPARKALTSVQKLSCIHRAGCPKPDVCAEVGHCTSMRREDLDAEKVLTSKQITRWRHRVQHGDIIQSDWGEWVRFDDIKHLLHPETPAECEWCRVGIPIKKFDGGQYHDSIYGVWACSASKTSTEPANLGCDDTEFGMSEHRSGEHEPDCGCPVCDSSNRGNR